MRSVSTNRRACARIRGQSRGTVQHQFDCLRQRARIARREQEPGFAVAYELAVSANVGGDEHAPLRHRFERLQWRDDLGEAHPMARIGEDVDQFVVAMDVGVRNAPREDHSIGESALRGQRLQRRFLRAAADQQHAKVRPPRRKQRAASISRSSPS